MRVRNFQRGGKMLLCAEGVFCRSLCCGEWRTELKGELKGIAEFEHKISIWIKRGGCVNFFVAASGRNLGERAGALSYTREVVIVCVRGCLYMLNGLRMYKSRLCARAKLVARVKIFWRVSNLIAHRVPPLILKPLRPARLTARKNSPPPAVASTADARPF